MKGDKTAVVLIEFQNESYKDGSKLHDPVKDEMARQQTVEHAEETGNGCPGKGALVIHCPFIFDEQCVDDKCVCGIIAGAKEGGPFRAREWDTKFIDNLISQEGDKVLEGKRALSDVTNPTLGEILEKHSFGAATFHAPLRL